MARGSGREWKIVRPSRRWEWYWIGAGVALRLAAYLAGRSPWLDESSLLGNITNGPTFALYGPLRGSQVAPPLFLLVERVLARLFGPSLWVLRLVPLLGGIASLGLLWAVADRILSRRAALIALALLAFSDEQIYYSTELKPYGTDLTVALALILATLVVRDGTLTIRRAFALAAAGALGVGFSFPAVFVLASAGLALWLEALGSRCWRRAAALCAVGAVWVAGIAGTWLAARSQVGEDRGLWVFWAITFPPPITVDPFWIPRRVLFFFLSPLDWHGPFDPRLSALPAILCALVGLIWLALRRSFALALLFGPLVLVLVASAIRAYPFHGRLLMFLVPAFLIAVAAGADRLWAWAGKVLGIILLVLLLTYPVALDLYHLDTPRYRSGLNPLGDRRPAWLMPDAFTPGIHVGPRTIPPMDSDGEARQD